MGTQQDFSLEVLHEDEARILFEMTMGEAKDPELRAIANEVVKRCAGLPLLVIIVATYLKNRELSESRDTLNNLFDFGNEELHEKVHMVLKSIYENLPSNEIKSFILLCALFGGPNIPVNYLLTYAMGLSLFGNIIRLPDARERLFQMIEKLNTESLLLDGIKNGYVKMHDVVLDVARSIATKKQHAFYGINGHGLSEWPSRDCIRIALHYCDINKLPQSLEYPKMELFLHFTKDLYLGIPNLFFEGFRELKVLNLSGMCFTSLPTSFHFLTNLHSLHLDGCQLVDVTIIGELKQLEFLSFAESYIVELPKQIMQLSQLKLLDLTNCTQLKVFPANVLSKLSLLEELYMGNSFVKWDMEENLSVMELEELHHLTTLEIQLIDAKRIPQSLFFRGLQRYRISIGDRWAWDLTYEASKTLKLKLKTVIHMKNELKELLRQTQALYLDNVRGIEKLLYDIDGKGCQQLKHLHIRNDNVSRHIINSTMWASYRVFPLLETLSLDNLKSLEVICYGQLENGSFSKFRILKISKCHELRDLFSPQLESIFSDMVTFPNLQVMRVSIMENLEHIWHSQLTADSFCKLKSLRISGCRNLVAVFSSNVVRRFHRLEDLDICNCPKIKEIYQLGEVNSNEVAPFELRYLYIRSMESLKRIWSCEDGDGLLSFQNLKSVEAHKCEAMKYVFPASIACGLLQLEKLEIWHCGVKHIVGKVKSIEADDEAPHNFNFPELTFLRLQNLRKLRSFYPKIFFSDWPKLKYLKVRGCHEAMKLDLKVSSNLETLMLDCKNSIEFSIERSFRLKVVELSHLKNGDNSFQFGFLGRLHSLEKLVLTCAQLKYIAPSSASFQNLTTLHVVCCDQLENLVTKSTAKNMVHLMKLRITFWEMMKEIVLNDGDDPKHEIIFNHLKCLELQYLPTLHGFCSGNYIFHFPLLEKVIVEGCLRMKIFCCGALSTPKLQGVQHWKYEEEVQYWDGNLNATIASQCFKERVLQNAYNWYLIDDSSSSKAVLANQLQFLNKLRKINVRDCDSVQVVFDLEDVSVEGRHGLLPELRKLQLTNLPKLSELWNKDPMKVFDFNKLRLLKVQNCSSLKYAFTQSMSSSLIKLQEIEVENCKMMEAIIKEEEGEEAELPSGLPLLEKISIKGCPSMKDFMCSVLSREQNPRPNEDGIREQLIGMQEHHEIVMPRLEELIIDWDIIKRKLDGNNQSNFFRRPKVIVLVFPSSCFLTMEELVLSDFLAEEIIFDGLDNHQEILPRVRKIILSKLPNLRHLLYDNDPRIVSVLQNLRVLQVWECNNLKILVPSFVYFQNLTFFQVSACDGLINLITASTTKSLTQLKKMYVGRCKMMQEIVVAESNREEDEISFFQLEYLVLDDLPCLKSFCSSENSFNFPCLEELFVIKCPNMKMFAQVLNTPKLRQVQTGGKEYEWEWEDNLNSTLQALSMKRKK